MNLTKILKQNISYILFLIIVLALLWLVSIKKEGFQDDSSKESVESELNSAAGFFSVFFFTLNHILYCKKNSINFDMVSDNWLFKYENGWTDYFEPYSLKFYDKDLKNIKKAAHGNVLAPFPIKDYGNIIPEVYRYNEKTDEYIHNKKEELDLLKQEYDSIFIRRGDKLVNESKYFKGDEYIEVLLEKNPTVSLIYVQTDDYTAVEEIQEYIDNKRLPIEVTTLCPVEQRGVIVDKQFLNKETNIEKNMDYMKNIKPEQQSKPVNTMTPDEKYDHTIIMLTGIDIVANSRSCVLDYQSNVSRFIKLFHKHPENVFNIESPGADINYENIVCPAYGF
jgi:hypothetical protein